MTLARLRLRIDRLLDAQGPGDAPSTAILLLPDNHRGPGGPRVRRVGAAVVVIYDVNVGAPTGAELDRLIKSTPN